MKNKPLKSNDLLKVILIIVVNIIMIGLSIGYPMSFVISAIPSVILLMAYYLMRREENASIFLKALIICKSYVWVTATVLFFLVTVDVFRGFLSYEFIVNIAYNSLILVAAFIYCLLIDFLLKTPFQNHQNWVVSKGFFSYSSNS